MWVGSGLTSKARGPCDGGIKGCTHWDVESEFWWSNWVGMYIKLETLLTHELHRLERFNQIADWFRTIGPSSVLCRSGSHTLSLHCVFCDVVCWTLFYFRLIYNEWFVTKRSRSSWSNTAGVLKHTSMSACWGILNLFITLLLIWYVLKLNCERNWANVFVSSWSSS